MEILAAILIAISLSIAIVPLFIIFHLQRRLEAMTKMCNDWAALCVELYNRQLSESDGA